MKVELGIMLNDARGKAGTTVFQKGPDGIIARPRVKGSNPQTPAQMAVRAALTRVARTYAELSPTQLGLWRAYANKLLKHNNVQMGGHKPTAFNAFVELGVKYILATGSSSFPLTPPTSQFSGDSISLTAMYQSGKIRFTASGANAANVTTELLIQPLANGNRKPQRNGYRIAGYFAFTSGQLTHDVTIPPGWYAAGYRFVNTQTGQASIIQTLPLGMVSMSVVQGGADEGTSKRKETKAA
jgi:hypothetical protein